MRLICALMICVLAASCAPRGRLDLVSGPPPAGAVVHRIHVATERNPERLDSSQFGEARGDQAHYGWVDVSVPPTHQRGRIEWPGKGAPDPTLHFVTLGAEQLADRAAFVRQVAAASPPGRDIMVFVHGYNMNNAEAVYQFAQARQDYGSTETAVLFSWPSAARVQGYIYDRDSVIFARDALERLLTDLTLHTGRRVQVVAHSMGTQLVMETLRQMSISGNRAPLRRLAAVALVAPDIDEDVFIRQMARIDPVPRDFTVLVTQQDRALGISALLTGRKPRLGAIRDLSALEELPIRVVDLTHVSDGWGLQHNVAFESEAAIDFLRGMARMATKPLKRLKVVSAGAILGQER